MVRESSLTFSPYFTVFSGESGSGKSLVFKAIRFCLGSRIDKSYIGKWDAHASVEVVFSLNDGIKVLLNELGIPYQDELVIEHKLYNDKRVCEINGEKIALKSLKAIAKMLVVDSEQGKSFKIQTSAFQSEYIDQLIDEALLTSFQNALKNKKGLEKRKQEIQDLLEKEDESWLEHQVVELQKYVIDVDEYERLQLLVDKNQSMELAKKEWLREKDNIQSIKKTLGRLQNIESVSIDEMIQEAMASIEAIEETFQSSMNIDMELQYEASNALFTLSTLNDLARKHKVMPKDLYTTYQQYQKTLEDIMSAKQDMVTIENKINEAKEELDQAFSQLMDNRKKKAIELQSHITQQLVLMGMEQASFQIGFQKIDEYSVIPVFEIKSNPGQDYKPIADCLSGGELSRLTILLTIYQNPNLVLLLDEVDSGVSGTVGIRIRDLLRSLSEKRQVIAISHLAQVASGAHNHFLVSKEQRDNESESLFKVIEGDSRAKELSRLMCGHIDETMVKQAKRLLLTSD